MAPSLSLILVTAGAILIWGVTYDAEQVDLDAIGVILIVVGLIGVLIWLILWDRWTWSARSKVGPPDELPRRTRIVEEEVERPPPPPPA